MTQLIEKISENPLIILALLSWPLLLFVGKVVSQKMIKLYEKK